MNRFLFLAISIVLIYSCNASGGESFGESGPSIDIEEYAKDWDTDTLEIATFAGGNFYGLEVVFDQLRGVDKAINGYTGGKKRNPSHSSILAGKGKHVMAVQVYYNPKKITYQMLLAVYFAAHDPLSKDKQGIEIGSQFQPIIFYHDDQQKEAAEKQIADYQKRKYKDKPILTEVKAYKKFWVAAEEHQDFAKKNLEDQYTQNVIKPFVYSVEKGFGAWMPKFKGVFPLPGEEEYLKGNDSKQ